jgi:tetratricopeptide (TPR) repeat protein
MRTKFQSKIQVLPAVVLGLAGLAPAASAQAVSCDAYFSQSSAMSAVVGTAFDAIRAKDAKAQAAALPAIEKELAKLQAAEVKPEVCNGNHINAYTSEQYARLSYLRARGINDFPAELPLVKQPTLNQANLAYAVGWIKYEQGNFDGALAAYEKGLAMFPGNLDLINEKLATLLQLSRNSDVQAYADAVLNDVFDMTDETRAKIYHARGAALFALKDWAGAEGTLSIAQRYNYTDDVESMLKQAREQKDKKN